MSIFSLLCSIHLLLFEVYICWGGSGCNPLVLTFLSLFPRVSTLVFTGHVCPLFNRHFQFILVRVRYCRRKYTSTLCLFNFCVSRPLGRIGAFYSSLQGDHLCNGIIQYGSLDRRINLCVSGSGSVLFPIRSKTSENGVFYFTGVVR